MTLAVAIAIAASLALTPLAKALAWRSGAVSQPDGGRRRHARATALWGGGSVYLALLLSVTVGYLLARGGSGGLPAALALSAGILCVLGCYDDVFEMRARWKLFWQIIATMPIVLCRGCIDQLVVLGQPIELGYLGIAFTMAWLVLGINAMNLLDGADGLASVVGIAIALAIAAIAAYQGDPAVLLLSLALVGALAGFLVYNLPPARIYLGDCGSMIIGLTLALLVLRVSIVGDSSTLRLTMASVLLFVPLVDTTLAIIRRTLNGKGLMTGDRGHIHHRLLDRGFGSWRVLAFLGAACLATGVVATLVAVFHRELWALGVLAVMLAVLVNRRLIGHLEWELLRHWAQRTTASLLPQRTPNTTGDRAPQPHIPYVVDLPARALAVELPRRKIRSVVVVHSPETPVPQEASSAAASPIEAETSGRDAKVAA